MTFGVRCQQHCTMAPHDVRRCWNAHLRTCKAGGQSQSGRQVHAVSCLHIQNTPTRARARTHAANVLSLIRLCASEGTGQGPGWVGPGPPPTRLLQERGVPQARRFTSWSLTTAWVVLSGLGAGTAWPPQHADQPVRNMERRQVWNTATPPPIPRCTGTAAGYSGRSGLSAVRRTFSTNAARRALCRTAAVVNHATTPCAG